MAGGLALSRRRLQDHGLPRGPLAEPRTERSSRSRRSTKPPSAELRPNQTDQDSLPPYDVLDGILKLYIEEWKEVDEIVAAGFDGDLVKRILTLVDTNEFKRRQAAPTIRVSNKAFGSGRQMPIAQRWRREPARDVR